MLNEEGLEKVFCATSVLPRRPGAPCTAWGLEVLVPRSERLCARGDDDRHARGHNADAFREVALEHFNMALVRASISSPARHSVSAISATRTS